MVDVFFPGAWAGRAHLRVLHEETLAGGQRRCRITLSGPLTPQRKSRAGQEGRR